MTNFQKRLEISGHGAAIYCCISDGIYAYTGSADKYVARWLLSTGEQDKFAIRFEQSIYALALLGDKILAAGLADGSLHCFDLESRQEIKYFQQHTVGIFSLHYCSVSELLFAGDAAGNLSVWNQQLKLAIYLPLDCGKIRKISTSSDGQFLALACQDGKIRVFETEHFNELHAFSAHENGTTSVLFHPTEPQFLYSGGKDALLKLWNWKEEKCLKSVVAHTFAIYDLALLSENTLLITASRDKHVKAWYSDTLGIIQRLDSKAGGHKHSVNALAKINESSFVSVSDDKRGLLWAISE